MIFCLENEARMNCLVLPVKHVRAEKGDEKGWQTLSYPNKIIIDNKQLRSINNLKKSVYENFSHEDFTIQ